MFPGYLHASHRETDQKLLQDRFHTDSFGQYLSHHSSTSIERNGSRDSIGSKRTTGFLS